MTRRVHHAVDATIGVLLLTFTFFLLGCQTGTVAERQTWLAAGETLNEIGKQFRSTGDTYNNLRIQGKVTSVEYEQFAEFAKGFQALYPVAVQSYKDAQTAKDAREAIDAILRLKSQLLAYTLFASQKR